MEHDDMQLAMDMFYEVMGWDKTSGAPLAETYRRLGLDIVT